MDTQISGLILMILAVVGTNALAYTLGKFYEFKAKSEQMSQLTLLASLWACVEANGLKRSTVIQRIIEKYNTGAIGDASKLQDMNDLMDGLVDTDEAEPKRGHETFMDTYDFDAEASAHPEDLV